MRAFLVLTILAIGMAVLILVDSLRSEEAVPQVVDGDTVIANGVRVRLPDIDAAEIHQAKCDAERRLGEVTKQRLEALLKSGPFEFRPALDSAEVKLDRYDRKLAQLLVGGVSVGCILMREGYARPWRGHRENWCDEASLAEWADRQQTDCGSTASIDPR